MARVAVLGAGSLGTAFAKVVADAGSEVLLWARRAEVVDAIQHTRTNPGYLPDVVLPTTLHATGDPRVALAGADIVALAIPAQSLRVNLTGWAQLMPREATLLSLAKGVELGTLQRMSQVICEVTGVDAERVAVLTGPNLAAEIARQQPTATVIACLDHERAVTVQQACVTGYFRPYTNTDVVGCELAGAYKNVIALACGMAVGMGMGDNSIASIITRGLAETARLGVALGAEAATFAGLAGMGDLVATCSSPLSRNRTFGARLGGGETLEQAQAGARGQVAEGAKSCSAITQLAASRGVEVPLADGVHRVCHDGLPAEVLAAELLGRSTKPE
ncbi:MAG: NAD(P)H-dependent glycerol-3-phosphate dehydrogenase [Mycobacteriaceae bacterium]